MPGAIETDRAPRPAGGYSQAIAAGNQVWIACQVGSGAGHEVAMLPAPNAPVAGRRRRHLDGSGAGPARAAVND